MAVAVVIPPVLVAGAMVVSEAVLAVKEKTALCDCYYFCWHQRGSECKGGPWLMGIDLLIFCEK